MEWGLVKRNIFIFSIWNLVVYALPYFYMYQIFRTIFHNQTISGNV